MSDMWKYRSKVVEIEAFRLDFNENEELTRMYPPWMLTALAEGTISQDGNTVSIKTLEGYMTGSDGDWIIKGTEGELYPCKHSVFERKYEKVK